MIGVLSGVGKIGKQGVGAAVFLLLTMSGWSYCNGARGGGEETDVTLS